MNKDVINAILAILTFIASHMIWGLLITTVLHLTGLVLFEWRIFFAVFLTHLYIFSLWKKNA